MELKRGFKGVWIPREIWLASDLNITEKAFLAEIDSLSTTKYGCFASNKHFAKFSGLSASRCSTIINDLERKGYVRINLVRKNGSKEIEKRYIKLNYLSSSYSEEGISEVKHPYFGNDEDSNTKDINTSNKDIVDSKESTKVNEYDKVPYFNEFWDKYPRKDKKKGALAPFKRQVQDRETLNLILKDIEFRLNNNLWNLEEKNFIPQASSYLNGERWLDEKFIPKPQYKTREVINKRNRVSTFDGIKPKD